MYDFECVCCVFFHIKKNLKVQGNEFLHMIVLKTKIKTREKKKKKETFNA